MDPRKIGLPDLDQLLLRELAGTGLVVVVEPLDNSVGELWMTSHLFETCLRAEAV